MNGDSNGNGCMGCGPQYMQAIKMGEEGQEGEMGLDVKQMEFHQTWLKIVLWYIDFI